MTSSLHSTTAQQRLSVPPRTTRPPRALTEAHLEPKAGHEGSFRVVMSYGAPNPLPAHLDGGAVMDGYVSLSWLSRLVDQRPDAAAAALVEVGLDNLLGR